MKEDGICDEGILIQKAVPAVPPPPPHVRENSPVSPSAFSALRSQSSSGQTALCFLHTYISDANPCLLHFPKHSVNLPRTNQQNDRGERSDKRQPMLSVLPPRFCNAVDMCGGFLNKSGECVYRDLCRYFPEKKRIGEGRRRL